MGDQELNTLNLHDMVERWQAGDVDAIDLLIRQISGRLEGLARKMLRNFPNVRGEADTLDVLQSSTLRLISSLRSLKPAGTRDFYNLAAVQIRRELIDLARRSRCRRSASLDSSETGQSDAGIDPVESTDWEIDRWARFHEAVDRLPTELRETVSLTFYHGWKQRQIAELFAVDDRTIRRWWQEACRRLRLEVDGGCRPGPAAEGRSLPA